MALSDTAIRSARPAERPYKLADGGGLFLQVAPNGSRLWRMKYRVDGREKLLAIGAYPAVTLAKAREKRDEAKALLADGIDPSRRKREAKRDAEMAASSTFRIIAEELVDKLRREGRAEITLAKKAWLLDFAYPAIGDRAITDISAADVLEILRRVEARGNHETATRLRSTIGAVFR